MTLKIEKADLQRIPESINFPQEEENILKYWKDEKIFENCLKQSKSKPRYTFYDGPPFATGLPHYGHILAGTIKDIVTRYAHQQGYHVERRFGWDTHGLPVEYEIDKTLGIKGPDDVAKMGIAAYNNECRKIVMRYAGDWEEIIGRLGRWIDFKNDYKTLYPWFMESVWWVFKQLYMKGLVYQGVKVMPYSTACTTALSNFESGQNYKDVQDPMVFVAMPLLDSTEKVSLIVWTTTPWTLPSNMACCVNPDHQYVKVKEIATGCIYIIMESRIDFVFKTKDAVEVLEKFSGIKLKGLRYDPPFDFFKKYENVAFRVLCDNYVTEESGSGIVHQAPYFGEDDYRVCLAHNVIKRDQEIVCPLDASGRFTNEVPDFQGQYVKDADKNIINALKKKGRLVRSGQHNHSYPFCWRSDTPLIYKAVPSWFVRVEHMTKQLLACCAQTYWVPDNIKEKRFGNWLREARDWAISRNRYWGTPIPIWMSPSGDEIVCIGSIEELEKLSGILVKDLHRETVDSIEIPSQTPGNPPLRRISEVFDCWFESGSMPYAQQHYPFENPNEFMNKFPADFIAEGIDQTRGWFYTLLVISTALFNKPPFKNLIANGLVLAADGQKMSKRKQNYPDPMLLVGRYGADAIRLYLINSPVVRAENLRFKEEGVRDIIKDVFLPWFNAYRFLFQNIERFEKEDKIVYKYDVNQHHRNQSNNVMDVWIVSFKESLLEFISKEMKAYRLYTVVPRLTKFIDQLTNWYVRMNRKRIKGEGGIEDCYHALNTLYSVLLAMVKMMAPFTPFLTEYMYQRLRILDESLQPGSVHYEMMPSADNNKINVPIERAVARMQAVVELGRVMRDRRTVPIKYPLTEVVVIHQQQEYLDDINSLQQFITGELNVRSIVLSQDRKKYGVTLRAEPDHKLLGIRLKNDAKIVAQKIKQLSDSDIQNQLKRGWFEIDAHRLELNEVRVIYQFGGDISDAVDFEAHSDNDVLVLLNMKPNQELVDEGTAREIINRIQKLKKKAKLIPTDPVIITYETSKADSDVTRVAMSHRSFIEGVVKSKFVLHSAEDDKRELVIEETQELKDVTLKLKITTLNEKIMPKLPWINVVLADDVQMRYVRCDTARVCTLNLEDFGGNVMTLEQLKQEVERVFGIGQTKWMLSTSHEKLNELKEVSRSLSGKTIFIFRNAVTSIPQQFLSAISPFSQFENKIVENRHVTVYLENPAVM
ncbi:CLUMA_CG020964, isoform A [Clunio marinus]|uniref:Isoleucine--tRNA ligase, cytoplasmic n=1 Tax=Clunio marinus TaxID=568069 RepID=A0A1J1J689_9DIPT|nr:CLUMA_CG020964, isoform A [Clunio marinus]